MASSFGGTLGATLGGTLRGSGPSLSRFSTQKVRSKVDVVVTESVPIRLDLVDKLCTQLEKRGLEIEGLYRLSGDAAQVQALWQKFFVEETQDIDIYQLDSHIITGALKLYLREQPVPLIPFSQYDRFIDCVANSQEEEVQIEALLTCVEILPPENKPIFHRLLSHLHEVSLRSNENKMTPENLGIVFGPTLMRPQKEDIHSLSRSNYPSLVFSILIKHWSRVKEKLPKGKSSYRVFDAPTPLSDRDWELLLATAEWRVFDPDDVILNEGELNMTLFRVSAGKVAIEKDGQPITSLGIGELFGEMSFLGRYTTSAQVRALELVKLQVIDCTYLAKILSLHPDLFLRFYWNLANSMAERLDQRDKNSPRQSPFLSACRNMTSRRVSIKSNHVIKINFKDNSFKTFTISDGTTVQGLCKIIATKSKIPHPEKFKIYETSDEMEKPMPLAMDEQVVRIMALRSSATYALYYCDTVPPVQKKAQIIIKDYPNTKLQNSMGWLYISHVSISHFAKRFGMEKKKTYSFGDIDFEDYKEGFVVSFFSRRKKKTFEIEFRTKDESREGYGIMNWACQKYQRKKREGRYSVGPVNNYNLNRGDVAQLSIQNSKFTRAIAVEAFTSNELDHLSFRPNDIICVLDKSSDWWFGETNGQSGIFPKNCVSEVLEAKATEKLMADGYKDLNDYPSRTDWKLILLGSYVVKYRRGDTILRAGDRFQRIYHVNAGSCKILLPENGKEVGTIDVYETFGELSFLRGGGTTANVIAAADEVEISVVDAEYLARLFQRDPILGGRFFKFLASVLERRIRFRSINQS